MANFYINYHNTVGRDKNDSIFMDNYKQIILDLHRKKTFEEKVNGYSYTHYDILKYYLALEYCMNLFFLTLEKLTSETIIESEEKRKKEYRFELIQEIMAHRGIDIHDIYDTIKIIYSPIDFETALITYPHYEA